MTLAELKEQIINNTISNDFKIFLCEDNTFLANQYINEICSNKGFVKNKINSIFEPQGSALSLVLNYETRLNILRVDTFEEKSTDYSQFENIIVVCSKVDKKLESYLSDFIIKFPKLTDWQVKTYMSVLCPGLTKEDIVWLYDVTEGDIYKIINELDKISLFEKQDQHAILDELKFDPNTDLFKQTIFDVADAIIKHDKMTLLEYLRHDKLITFDPIAISNIILSTLKKIILIKYNSGASIEELGVSAKQFNAFKKFLYNECKPDQVFNELEFISQIDLMLKSSKLDLTNNKKLDYIICKMA